MNVKELLLRYKSDSSLSRRNKLIRLKILKTYLKYRNDNDYENLFNDTEECMNMLIDNDVKEPLITLKRRIIMKELGNLFLNNILDKETYFIMINFLNNDKIKKYSFK